MRDDYIKAARKIIFDPYILVNIVSLRVKQLRQGSRPMVESLEKLSFEDTALREIAERKISFELGHENSDYETKPNQYHSGFKFSPVVNRDRPQQLKNEAYQNQTYR